MTGSSSIPQPHGGRLVSRFGSSIVDGMYAVPVSGDLRNDVENIADGVFSPLEGFVARDDFESIVSSGRLKSGLAWTVPIVLDVDDETATKIRDAGDFALENEGELFATVRA